MKKVNSNIKFRIPKILRLQMLEDLKRIHDFASERVGFLFAKTSILNDGSAILLATEYHPIKDEDYIDDPEVGAKINADAIRFAMQKIRNDNLGCFHVHLHNHTGLPEPSFIDAKGLPPVVDSFSNISSNQANGFLILSKDSAYTAIKLSKESGFYRPEMISFVGYPIKTIFSSNEAIKKSSSFQRQTFLGKNSEKLFRSLRIGIIGYGGGGSHIGLQLAHIGFKKLTVFDDDSFEDHNLNRLVGAWNSDIKKRPLKTEIAKRTIKKILPSAELILISDKWQNNPHQLKLCDIVIGCVDTFEGRYQLEVECRRHLIPYIDIGMDVHSENEDASSISGQIILSMPGSHCLRCYGFLTDEKLTKEAAKYGNVGGRPQVIWPNGLLASTAVGILVDMITGWSLTKDRSIYLAYDGNNFTLQDHVRLRFANKPCSHFPLSSIGEVQFKRL